MIRKYRNQLIINAEKQGMSVYFLAAKVTKARCTLTGALLATLAGTVASVALARWMV